MQKMCSRRRTTREWWGNAGPKRRFRFWGELGRAYQPLFFFSWGTLPIFFVLWPKISRFSPPNSRQIPRILLDEFSLSRRIEGCFSPTAVVAQIYGLYFLPMVLKTVLRRVFLCSLLPCTPGRGSCRCEGPRCELVLDDDNDDDDRIYLLYS